MVAAPALLLREDAAGVLDLVRFPGGATWIEAGSPPAVVSPVAPPGSRAHTPPLNEPALTAGIPRLPRAAQGRRFHAPASAGSALFHVALVLALAFAPGEPGLTGESKEAPVEIEIIVEPARQAAPEIAPVEAIDVELPPPVPLPVIEIPPEPAKAEPEAESVPEPDPPPARAEVEPEIRLPEPPQVELWLDAPAIELAPPQKEPERSVEERKEEAVVPPPPPPPPAPVVRAPERPRTPEKREPPRAAPAQPRQASVARQAGNPSQGRAGAQGQQAARGNNGMSVSAFLAAVAGKIARNKPAASTAAAAQGVAVIGFAVSPSGAATGLRVVRSSGSNLLDQAAMGAVRRASPFPPPPPGAPRSFSVPMRFNVR